jgi:queuine tRNA-ribosyltransferase
VGRIHTPHGIIDTPGFVPVGTNAALKGMTNAQSTDAGVQLMFCNTYHLIVHPGPDVVAEAGGLHAYMGRTRPIITDSGGFQVFSLAASEAADGPELKRRSATRGRNEGTLLSVTVLHALLMLHRSALLALLPPERWVLPGLPA